MEDLRDIIKKLINNFTIKNGCVPNILLLSHRSKHDLFTLLLEDKNKSTIYNYNILHEFQANRKYLEMKIFISELNEPFVKVGFIDE